MESFPVGVWKLVCENLPAPCVLRLVRVNRKLSGLEHLPLNWCHHEEYKIGDYVDTKRTIERAKELSRFRWTGLRVLECDDGDLQQIVTTFPHLNHLESAFANMRGLNALQALKSTLGRLVLKNATHLSDTAALQGFTCLKKLAISWCAELNRVNLSDAACPMLREVNLYQCQSLRTIEALPCSLRSLTVGCPAALTDMSAVAACRNLEQVSLTWCESLTAITALSHCSKLKVCDLHHCVSLVSVEPLSSLQELVDLNLSHCKLISDISALSGCSKLAVLKLVGCRKIQDLSSLKSCRLLGKLDISFCLNARGAGLLGQIGQIIQAQ